MLLGVVYQDITLFKQMKHGIWHTYNVAIWVPRHYIPFDGNVAIWIKWIVSFCKNIKKGNFSYD